MPALLGATADLLILPLLLQTVYRSGEEIIAAFPDISQVTLKLPNIHFFHFNIDRFGLKNENEVYYPTEDGAHGQLEATVIRTGAASAAGGAGSASGGKAIRAKL